MMSYHTSGIVTFFVLYCFLNYKVSNGNSQCGKRESEETSTPLTDPRRLYDVDVDVFLQPEINIEVINEITTGNGYVMLPQLFKRDEIKHARELILYLIEKQGKKATHFQGSKDSKADLQARVWNLLDKGQIFEKMVQHPTILAIVHEILGDDAQLGSIASNTIFPGGSGQEPHVDYPYWDYYNREHWPVPPKHQDIPFFMNLQATILLDDFTEENGATALRSGTQITAEYPQDSETFFKHYEQAIGNAGDVMVFVGLLQHCAMPNKSNFSRTGILLQYLPKYIRPMEDIKRSIGDGVKERMSPELKKLLLWDYPYPAILDKAEATNSEGSKSNFKWKA